MANNRLWDSYVRIFHWAQAGLIPALWWTAEAGEMDWHLWLASLLLSLWLVRLGWGLWGSDSARFGQFIYSPATVIAYLRGAPAPRPGHNPAGGYMVVLLLLGVGVQLATGLFANDGIITAGPLSGWVSGSLSDALTQIHKINFNLLLGLIAVHLLAVVVYAVKGQRLVPAMISGGRASGVKLRNGLWGLVAAIVVWAAMVWLWELPLPW